MTEQALSGVKVLDLTWYIAGPYCTKCFADYGADVIKVERPDGGDIARRMGPFPGDIPHPEKSGLFLHVNTNKKGITLNLKTKTAKEIFKELIKGTDILVESFSPRVMPTLGLDFETLEKINPKLVMTSISNFGQTGPYRDFKATEIIQYAMGGAMECTGIPEREPARLGGTVVQFQAGNVAAAAAMGALMAGKLQGVGQYLDISIMETQLGTIDRRRTIQVGYAYSGSSPYERGKDMGMGILPIGIFPCRDGYVQMLSFVRWWPRLVKMLDMPELLSDPRFAKKDDFFNPERKDEFEAILLPWLLDHTKQEVTELAQAARIPVTPINTPKDVVENPHFKERDFFVEIDHPAAGMFKYPGAPFRSEDNKWLIRGPAPLLGQHNEEIYCGMLGYSREELVQLREMNII